MKLFAKLYWQREGKSAPKIWTKSPMKIEKGIKNWKGLQDQSELLWSVLCFIKTLLQTCRQARNKSLKSKKKISKSYWKLEKVAERSQENQKWLRCLLPKSPKWTDNPIPKLLERKFLKSVQSGRKKFVCLKSW